MLFRSEIIEIFNFIDVLLELKNESIRKIYYQEVIKVASTKKKEIIGDFQKMAMKEGRKEGIREGIKEGIKEGKIKERNEIAKKLKEEGIDIKIIIKTTGLSKPEIENL